MSKGSRPRPFDIPKKQFDENFEKIFGKKKQPTPERKKH